VIPRTWIVPLCIGLCVLAGILVLIGLLYFFLPAAHLPSWLPGHVPGRPPNRYKVHIVSRSYRVRAVLAFFLASGPLAAAWWLRFRYEPPD
jgi:hypothetical protein